MATVTAKRFNFTQYATCTRIDRQREREREREREKLEYPFNRLMLQTKLFTQASNSLNTQLHFK